MLTLPIFNGSCGTDIDEITIIAGKFIYKIHLYTIIYDTSLSQFTESFFVLSPYYTRKRGLKAVVAVPRNCGDFYSRKSAPYYG